MRVAVLLMLSLFSLSGCAPVTYVWDVENDLDYAVVVSACEGCGNGQRLEPGASESVTVKQNADITLRRTDGTVIGCATVSSDGSTSDAAPVRASDFVGLACER
jgi:hypothetical protein